MHYWWQKVHNYGQSVYVSVVCCGVVIVLTMCILQVTCHDIILTAWHTVHETCPCSSVVNTLPHHVQWSMTHLRSRVRPFTEELFQIFHVCLGNPPLSLHFPLHYILLYLLVSCTFPFSLSYSLHLFSCFFIPSHSNTIVPPRFHAGCRRRQLMLALVVCVCWLCVICIFS